MRIQKTVFTVGILLIMGLCITGVTNAAAAASDMSQWVGKWFSFKMITKGIIFDGSNFIKASEKNSGYFKVESWNQGDEKFEITIYSQNNGGWEVMTQYMNYLAGNNLSFLFGFQDEEQQFVGQVVGKEKKGILSGASIQTYGGLVLAEDDNQRAIGSVVLKAKMIDESKVKAPH